MNPEYRIVDLRVENEAMVKEAARMLVYGFGKPDILMAKRISN